MEALYFLKFWRPTSSNKDHRPSSGNSDTTDYEFDEEDESFFELELTVPDFDNNKCNQIKKNNSPIENDPNHQKLTGNPHPPSISLSPNDHLFSKRKILPIEPSSKPQSPISLLKSAPRFRVLMFKKSKSVSVHGTDEKTGEAVFIDNSKTKKRESKLFTVKFKLKEAANVPIFTRDNSLRRKISDDSLTDDSSKPFSKEVIQKYLKLIKPLYIKVSKKLSEKQKLSGELSAPSTSSSPATLPSGSPKKEKQGSIPAGIRVVCKHLGKSKSASAATTAPPSTAARRDDSLLLQHDGIQSAILHCKKSFNSSSSRESSISSLFANDPSYDKSMASPRISYEGYGID